MKTGKEPRNSMHRKGHAFFNRRAALLLLVLLVTALVLVSCSKGAGASPPNFIIIFTDDQGYGDMGCTGASGFQTPNLDRLAASGIRFTDFYVPATVCTPSRAGLLTGCYPKRVGLHEAVLFPFSQHGLNPEETILPEWLKPLGYTSACVGKWHLGHKPEFMPNNQGFDYFYGVPYSNDMDAYIYKNPPFNSPPLPLYENEEHIVAGPDQRYLTRKYTEAAVSFIQKHKERPFLLYLAHSMPHLPWHVSEKFKDSSALGLYGDVIQEIDWSVGEILATLEETGLVESTLVLFTSDNGPVLMENSGSAGPLRGRKATTWEGGQRVPCLVSWPGTIPEGKICKALTTTMDLVPTFIKLAGGEIPEDHTFDGYDIQTLLMNPLTAETAYEAFYYYSRDGKPEAVRSGKWKLHIEKSRGWDTALGPFPVSLYDLSRDIGESNNLADENPQIVERLTRKIREFDEQLTKESRPAGRLQ
jgi:arylsulfatase A